MLQTLIRKILGGKQTPRQVAVPEELEEQVYNPVYRKGLWFFKGNAEPFYLYSDGQGILFRHNKAKYLGLERYTVAQCDERCMKYIADTPFTDFLVTALQNQKRGR